MTQSHYRDARRVFRIVDNGASNRGQPYLRRLTEAFRNLVPVHGPVHPSWLSQIGICFPIVQCRAFTLDSFFWPGEVEDRLLRFRERCESMAAPFDWWFTRDDLARLTRMFLFQPSLLRLAA